MVKIVSVDQMVEIESAADAAGHSYAAMMELAGKSIAQFVIDEVEDIEGKSVLILAGSGNNGGDGLVVGNLLAARGAQVGVYLTRERSDADPHLAALRERGVLIVIAESDQRSRVLKLQLGKADIVIDAILGTGFRLPLKGTAQAVLRSAKRTLASRERMPMVVAVDCPSGLDCDTGEVADESLSADLTVTLAAAKPGLLRFPGAALVGRLVVGTIGLEAKALEHIRSELVTSADAATWLPRRAPDAHKGSFGRALIVAGSRSYPGAAVLAAEGAYRAGAGLVTLAVPQSVQPMLAPQIPEATWVPLPESEGVLNEAAVEVLENVWRSSDAILVGPGFGLERATRKFVERLLSQADSLPPTVLDADVLKHIAALGDWHTAFSSEAIVTPHPGEMSVLTRIDKERIQEDRLTTALEWAATWQHIVVLKGAYTVIAAPSGASRILPFATPALASAGTGDVLAGLITGLVAQGVAPYEAAALGAAIHGRSGELAAEALGTAVAVMAGDVSDAIPAAIAELEQLAPH